LAQTSYNHDTASLATYRTRYKQGLLCSSTCSTHSNLQGQKQLLELGPAASNMIGGSRLLLTSQRDYSHSASAKGTPRVRPSKVRLLPPSARLRSSSGLFILRIALNSACSQKAHLQPSLLQGNKLACVLLPGFVYFAICAFANLLQLFVLIHRTFPTPLLARSVV